jgi:hypothetical protein
MLVLSTDASGAIDVRKKDGGAFIRTLEVLVPSAQANLYAMIHMGGRGSGWVFIPRGLLRELGAALTKIAEEEMR